MSNTNSTFVVSEELEYLLFAGEDDSLNWDYVELADEYQAFSDQVEFLDREFQGYDFEEPLKLEMMVQVIKEADGYYFFGKSRG